MILPETLEKYDHQALGDAIYFTSLTNEEYHNSPGISSSVIRKFMDSQIHAMEEDVLDTPALKFGTAAHALIVEGDKAFAQDIACIEGSPYTQYNKNLKADFEERGMTVITKKDRDDIFRMRDLLIPEAKKLLQPSENEYPSIFNYPYERAIYWFENDLLLKVKSDILRYPLENAYAENKIILVDYKTTQSCEPSSFLSSVKRYKYDLQAAWYRRGFEKAGFEVLDFYFVAQEKKHPYASKIFKMKKEDMDKGWEVLEKNLQDYAKVLDGERPTVYNTPNIVELSLSDEE